MNPPAGYEDQFSYDSNERSWRERFPSWAIGYWDWLEFSHRLEGEPGTRLIDQLPGLATRRLEEIPGPRPRVFISHRHADRDAALNMAALVRSWGFDYWLDVLNPDLLNLPPTASPEPAQAVAMASIIEMGLLNSSHLLVLYTDNTQGSVWVPYEYGRAKEPPPVGLKSSCWIESGYTGSLPEYMWLGPVHDNQPALRSWLNAQPPLFRKP
jgi:hypothetical protein